MQVVSGAVGAAKSTSAMMSLYSDDSPGFKVRSEPLVVLVFSIVFVGSVFLLHIWAKYTK
ncbi:hypothetical protein ROZALSC1DRAFT_28402 [Rozella allomycis CSF55]|uniref:Protein transport protein Sec61 subunit beta n=1 Tax=Rozella allomycis (strain CSF55) TaxID=988480 RepID=A0A4P9YKD7_ROZAC|nr:hypothetical protein ROZALSC1DRAFT_28402 [Rozella allomycis CSF55]